MGEYFNWINLDKKEYLVPSDFGLGSKLYESTLFPNGVLRALYDLLSTDWKGDSIVFLGDYAEPPKTALNSAFEKMLKQFSEYEVDGIEEIVTDHYKLISGLYKDAKKEVTIEIKGLINCEDREYAERVNWYRISFDDPWAGLFVRDGKSFRFGINDSRREYFDLNNVGQYEMNGKLYSEDPLPLLLAYGDRGIGRWLGDAVRVTDDAPPENYKDISSRENIIGNNTYITE